MVARRKQSVRELVAGLSVALTLAVGSVASWSSARHDGAWRFATLAQATVAVVVLGLVVADRWLPRRGGDVARALDLARAEAQQQPGDRARTGVPDSAP